MQYNIDIGGNMSFLLKTMDALGKVERSIGAIANKKINFEAFRRAAQSMESFNNSLQNSSAQLLEYTSKAAGLSDAMAITQKNTGLADDQIKALGLSLKGLDTRTSHADLLAMASSSGKLGVPKEEILGFVRAVDKAKVAMGDEFGNSAEQVTMALGKIKGVYKEFDGVSFENSFLQLGSAINYLGKQGANSAPVVADFMQRVSTMGLGAADAAGLGATLQEFGLSAEIGSGGLKAILTVAKTESASFASYLRMPTKEWEKLLNTDPSGAVDKLTKSFKGASSTQIAQTLAKLKIGSQESQQVMMLLANNTDLLAERQMQAAYQISKKNDLDKEAAIMNNTQAAGMEKMQKRFDAATVSIGQFLAPYSGVIQASSGVSNILATAIPLVAGMSGMMRSGAVAAGRYIFGLTMVEGKLAFTKKSFAGAMWVGMKFSYSLMTNGLRAVGLYAQGLVRGAVVGFGGFISRSYAALVSGGRFAAFLVLAGPRAMASYAMSLLRGAAMGFGGFIRRAWAATVATARLGAVMVGTGVRSVGRYVFALVSGAVAGLGAFVASLSLATMWQGICGLATSVMTGAQWLLNAALTANPIGVAVMALAALAAGLYLAYIKCEGFRRVVDMVFSWIGKGLSWCMDKITEALEFFGLLSKQTQEIDVKMNLDNADALGAVGAVKQAMVVDNDTTAMYAKAGVPMFGVPVMKAAPGAGGADAELLAYYKSQGIKTDTKGNPIFGDEKQKSVFNSDFMGQPEGKKEKASKARRGAQSDINEVSGGGSRPVNIRIEIDSLVKQFTVQSTSVKESARSIEDVVSGALMRVLNGTAGYGG